MDVQLPHISDPNLLKAMHQHAKILEFAPGEAVIQPGQYIKMVPIVLEGSLKVIRTDEDGHELFLYHIESGESCAVSLTCCNTQSASEVKAVAEEKTRILAVPLARHEEWSNTFRQWKDFVAQTYQKRFQALLQVVDEVAFKKMDERLLKYLLVKARQLKSNELSITHQEIAAEMGTSREVVSRLLKQLEKRKLVELGRNRLLVREDLEHFLS